MERNLKPLNQIIILTEFIYLKLNSYVEHPKEIKKIIEKKNNSKTHKRE